jgi:hypothetical protein
MGLGTYQRGLTSSLDAIQTYEEWWWSFHLRICLLVRLDTFENEGHAMLRLVVDDFRHTGGSDFESSRLLKSFLIRGVLEYKYAHVARDGGISSVRSVIVALAVA